MRTTKVILSILCVILNGVAFLSPLGQRAELWFFDIWMSMRGQVQAPDNVVVVSMDEQSYQQLNIPYTKAWPRRLHSELIEKLRSLGAKKVIFDVLFVGEGEDKVGDTLLENAIAQMPVILGAEIESNVAAGYTLTQLVTPYERFADRAATLALVNLPEDQGQVRHFMQSINPASNRLPSFAEAAAGFLTDKRLNITLPNARDLIKYYAPAGQGLRAISYYQLLEKEVPFPRELIENKIIFVGLMLRTEVGPAQKDSFLTPFGRMFGVEIHATAAANLINNDWIKRFSSTSELVAISVGALALSYLSLSLSPLIGAIIIIAAIIIWGGCASLLITNGIAIPGAVLFCITTPLTYTTTTLYNYIQTKRRQKQVERAFGHYLAPEMVAELARNPDALRLGGEIVEATALFTDLADFTSISESLSAQDVIKMLNQYFSAVAKVVFAEGGTLIKFIGDSMFVLWGAPIRMTDHAERAARTTFAIQKAVKEFNAQNLYPALVTRIGVHTGPMVVGNLGSETRFDYTAIGDTVNLASRIEGINKYLGTSILISENTYQSTKSANCLKIGTMQVKGREVPVTLYTVFEQPLDNTLQEKWREALRYFQTRKWDNAKRLFLEVAALSLDLKQACEFYVEQITQFQETGAKASWKGELVFSSK